MTLVIRSVRRASVVTRTTPAPQALYESVGAVAAHVAAGDPHGDRAFASGAIAAAVAGCQPASAQLSALAALTGADYGRSLLTLSSSAALRGAAELGSAALASASDFDPAGSAAAQASAAVAYAVQRANHTGTQDWTTLTGTPTTLAAYGIADALTTAQVAAGYQPLDAALSALAGLTSAADRLPYFTGEGVAALATFTAAGRALVDDADAPAQRATLGLGTIATQNATAVAITGGAINGTPIGATAASTGRFSTLAQTSNSGIATPGLLMGSSGVAGIFASAASIGFTVTGTQAFGAGSDGLVLSDTWASQSSRFLSDGGNFYAYTNINFARAQMNSHVFANASANGVTESYYKKRGSTKTDFTSLVSNDLIHRITWSGDNGTARQVSAQFSARAVGTPDANRVPMRLAWEIEDAAGTIQPVVAMHPDLNVTLGTLTTDGVNRLQVNGSITVATGNAYKVNNVQVVAARRAGWATWTGTASRVTRATYDSGSAPALYNSAAMQAVMDAVRDLSQAHKALIDDLHSTAGHGLIGT